MIDSDGSNNFGNEDSDVNGDSDDNGDGIMTAFVIIWVHIVVIENHNFVLFIDIDLLVLSYNKH